MKVTIDQDLCCSAGQCVLAAPEVFDQSDDDGLVRLRRPSPEAPLQADVRLAAALCPSGAITVTETPDAP